MPQEKIKNKICTKCGEEKPNTTEFFYKSKNTLMAACKVCKNNYRKKYYTDNKEVIADKKRVYREKNKEMIREKKAEYRKKNPNKHREWYEKNKADQQAKRKIYREKNKESIRAKAKISNQAYYEANREYILERNKEYNRRKRIESGKPLDSRAKPDSLYIGYVHLTYGTFFKVGITSRESMLKRYKQDRDLSKDLVGVDCIYYQHIGADDVRKAERDLVSVCREAIGKPIKGIEWFKLPTIQQLVKIMESVNA